jgi:thiol-disulfide isomerase/thioredoxin
MVNFAGRLPKRSFPRAAFATTMGVGRPLHGEYAMTQLARRLGMVVLLGALMLWGSDAAPARPENNPAAIRAEKVKYADLCNLVRANKGKVVVVDFWATNCRPCIAEFPSLVKLNTKYKQDGLLAISVSLDDPANEALRPKILSFLERQKADQLTNVQMDDTWDLVTQKLDINGIPCVYVFNQDGRIAGKWSDKTKEADYGEIEKMVAELLKK